MFTLILNSLLFVGRDVEGFTVVNDPSITDSADCNGLAQQGGLRVRGESTRVSP